MLLFLSLVSSSRRILYFHDYWQFMRPSQDALGHSNLNMWSVLSTISKHSDFCNFSARFALFDKSTWFLDLANWTILSFGWCLNCDIISFVIYTSTFTLKLHTGCEAKLQIFMTLNIGSKRRKYFFSRVMITRLWTGLKFCSQQDPSTG